MEHDIGKVKRAVLVQHPNDGDPFWQLYIDYDSPGDFLGVEMAGLTLYFDGGAMEAILNAKNGWEGAGFPDYQKDHVARWCSAASGLAFEEELFGGDGAGSDDQPWYEYEGAEIRSRLYKFFKGLFDENGKPKVPLVNGRATVI